MFKAKHKQFTKRIMAILLLIQLSIIWNNKLLGMNAEKELVSGFEIYDEYFEADREEEDYSARGRFNKDSEKTFHSTDEKVALEIFDSQECLYDKSEAQKLLLDNGFQNKSINTNLQFILGKCNPILLIPGLYSSRLLLKINCKKFTQNQENLINLRLFCSETLCSGDQEDEEHVLWPALFDSPFQLHINSDTNKFSACFGYFFKFHKINECPKIKVEKKTHKFFSVENEIFEESICLHDDAVKITFFGGTEQTEKNSKCGLGGIKNIVSVGNQHVKESWFNSGAARAYEGMHNRFYEMGYRPGFSMAGLPYDFRRFISTNDLFKIMFKSQIERLYESTGKPVIIVAHSFGCLNALNQIVENENDPNFLKKIKKFIAVAPPFAGAPKEVELFLYGSNEFDTKFSFINYDLFDVELDEFGQRLVLPLTPAGYELKPNPILSEMFSDSKYEGFKLAIEERLNLEKECRDKDCEQEFIERNSKLFNEVFPHFPTLHSSECKIEDYVKDGKYLSLMKDYFNSNLPLPNLLPCRNEIYDTVKCPTIKIRLNVTEEASIIETHHCSEIKPDNNDLFNHLCDKTKNCLDAFFHDHYPYPYLDPKMLTLFERFNLLYSKEFPDAKLDVNSYFETKEVLKKKIEKMIEYQNIKSTIKNLNTPKVDTMIIYASFAPTKTAYIFDQVKNQKAFEKSDILMKGGDGTVPTWSSLLIGLKWLYEKKVNNLEHKVQLVEFCSNLSKKDSTFGFDIKNPEKEFFAISCDCLNSDNFHDFKKTSSGACDHSNFLGDSHLIKFLENYLMNEENEFKMKDSLPVKSLSDSITKAIQNYNPDQDYESACNLILRQFVDNE